MLPESETRAAVAVTGASSRPRTSTEEERNHLRIVAVAGLVRGVHPRRSLIRSAPAAGEAHGRKTLRVRRCRSSSASGDGQATICNEIENVLPWCPVHVRDP